jgi:deoxyribodipyrimidine photo-lyase
MPRSEIPALRRRLLNDRDFRRDGEHVLYWVTAFRRARWSFALQRAVELANAFERPLVVLEALRCGYRWANDRLQRFVIEGMADNAAAFGAARDDGAPVLYYPWLEREDGEGHGLLEALAERACMVVGDDAPVFFLPRMVEAAARRCPVRFEAVDSNGLLPLRAAGRVFARAYDFRRFLQSELPEHLVDLGVADPLAGLSRANRGSAGAFEIPKPVARRWRPEDPERLASDADGLVAECDVDHSVPRVAERGGAKRGTELVQRFVEDRLHRYVEGRTDLDDRATSELSFHLHFGHTAVQEVFVAVAEREGWTPERLAGRGSGQREGWWGMSADAEAFLDQLVTWRELGFNMAWQVEGYDRYESLPAWARETLEEHAGDQREVLYDLRELERAETGDPIWNAAQRELLRDGRIHNYLRMLWGKKILEWSPSPRVALERMIELNNRYAVDGRDPSSYSGIFWCLGRYDRAWGPERPVYGKVRYMSSANTRRKMRVEGYLRELGEP